MNIQQIRNALLVIHYAGKKVVIDPMLGEKGSFPPFQNTPRQDLRNPIVDLPIPVNDILEDVDAIIVTHLHEDHWDKGAVNYIPKATTLFSQNEEDAKVLEGQGFTNVEVLEEATLFHDMTLRKTDGRHGYDDDIVEAMGSVMGVIFSHPDEKTLYIAGDTVYYDGVERVIEQAEPDIIVVNSGANIIGDSYLLMLKEDVYKIHQKAPQATIIASHMEAVNHWTLSRKDLKAYAQELGFDHKLLVPDDGEDYTFD